GGHAQVGAPELDMGLNGRHHKDARTNRTDSTDEQQQHNCRQGLEKLRDTHHGGETQASLLQWTGQNGVHPVAPGCSWSGDGSLLFQQVPMVEIDGMKLVQTRAILNYIANKYNLYGKDLKERALIDMYGEGVADLGEMILTMPLCPPDQKDAKVALIKERAVNRYLPAFEKVLKSHGQDYLVGNSLSRVDIHLVELLYYVEELDSSLLANFPLLKALKARVSSLPNVKKFLQPGNLEKPRSSIMPAKPKLYYFNARGRMECIRWLLAAAGVEFEEKFIEAPADLEKLKTDGSLLFQQVPLVEIDGMKLVQTRAILNYIANKYNLYGKDLKERALIDMYGEGVADLGEMILTMPLCPPDQKDAKVALIKERAVNRYLPAFEKVSGCSVVGVLRLEEKEKTSSVRAVDIHLVELLYYVEELDSSLLANFPLLKPSEGRPTFPILEPKIWTLGLALKARVSSLPNVKKFLQPGSQRKPPIDEKALEEAKKIFNIK
ncbi:Glutathione S-transferase A2, partial [Galemys pyrenaicus]